MTSRPGLALLLYDLDALGGAERQAEALARELARQGERVLVVTTTASRGRALRLERRAGDAKGAARVRVVRAPAWLPFAWWSYALTTDLLELVAAWAIRRHARRARAVLGVPFFPTGASAARVARALGRPAAAKLACSGSVGDLAALERDPRRSELAPLLTGLDRVVYLNEESRSEALAAGIPASRLRAIPNGVELAAFPPEGPRASLEELGFPPDAELVLFVGRLEPQKRVLLLVEAFARLLARRPRARLALVGRGSLEGALEARIRELGLEGRARLLGTRTDVPALLRAARVFALPSGEEGQSNALLEAMAARVPSVASDVPGNRALAPGGREALLVPVDDALALEAALGRVLEDGALARSLAEAGRARARELSLERVAGLWRALARELGRPGPIPELAFWSFVLGRAATIVRVGASHALARAAAHADLALRRAVTAVVLGLKSLVGA